MVGIIAKNISLIQQIKVISEVPRHLRDIIIKDQ